jgi:regulator of PEP synthase PpsR (kinase-PPPase family)
VIRKNRVKPISTNHNTLYVSFKTLKQSIKQKTNIYSSKKTSNFTFYRFERVPLKTHHLKNRDS